MSGPVYLDVFLAGCPYKAILSTVDPTSALPTRVWEQLGRPSSTTLQANDEFSVSLSLRFPPGRSFPTTFRVYDKLKDVVIGIQDMKDANMLLDFSNCQVHVSPEKRTPTRRQDDDRHSVSASTGKLTFGCFERTMASKSETEFVNFRKRRRIAPYTISSVDRNSPLQCRSEIWSTSEVDLRSLLNRKRTPKDTIPSDDWRNGQAENCSEGNKSTNSPVLSACIMTPPDEETLKDEEDADKLESLSTEHSRCSSSLESKSSWDDEPEVGLLYSDEEN